MFYNHAQSMQFYRLQTVRLSAIISNSISQPIANVSPKAISIKTQNKPHFLGRIQILNFQVQKSKNVVLNLWKLVIVKRLKTSRLNGVVAVRLHDLATIKC